MATDYSTSRYGDAVAEWADSITGDGFAVATAGDVETIGWYALVDLRDAAAFLPDGETLPDLAEGSRVIIRANAQGFIDVYYGPAHPLGDPPAYRALMTAWAAIVAEDAEEDA